MDQYSASDGTMLLHAGDGLESADFTDIITVTYGSVLLHYMIHVIVPRAQVVCK